MYISRHSGIRKALDLRITTLSSSDSSRDGHELLVCQFVMVRSSGAQVFCILTSLLHLLWWAPTQRGRQVRETQDTASE